MGYTDYWIDLQVDVTCEACNHTYSYPHTLKERRVGILSAMFENKPHDAIAKRLAEGDLGVVR